MKYINNKLVNIKHIVIAWKCGFMCIYDVNGG